MNECWILSNAFSASIEMILVFFNFSFFNVVYYIDLYILNSFYKLGANPSGSWCMIIFCVLVFWSFSNVWLIVTPWVADCQASLPFAITWSWLKWLMSIESIVPSNHLILCHTLLFLPSIFPSIWVFSSELALHIRLPKYWSFSFSHQTFQWIFRGDLL